MIFTIKMHWKLLLSYKCNETNFYYENGFEIIFSIKIYWKLFLRLNTIKLLLLEKCIRNSFYNKNALEVISQKSFHYRNVL